MSVALLHTVFRAYPLKKFLTIPYENNRMMAKKKDYLS